MNGNETFKETRLKVGKEQRSFSLVVGSSSNVCSGLLAIVFWYVKNVNKAL